MSDKHIHAWIWFILLMTLLTNYALISRTQHLEKRVEQLEQRR